jgi:hypothetical protein
MIAAGITKSAVMLVRRGESFARDRLAESIAASPRKMLRASAKPLGLALAIALLTTGVSNGGVLSEADVKKVEDIRPLFQNLMGDLVQTSRRQDISGGDADCVKSIIRELLEISQELSSYEYLITIEKDMINLNDDDSMRDVIKFAVDKSNTILSDERKRLTQLSECTRSPLSSGKTQQTLQFIDTTTGLLKSIQGRL